MDELARIRPVETARVDRGRLEALVQDYGTQGAERLMGRTLEEIAVRLNRIERFWRQEDHVRLCHGARELSDVADRVGLVGVAAASATVSGVAMTGDSAALGATVCRLLRVGEAALMSVWEVEDLTV